MNLPCHVNRAFRRHNEVSRRKHLRPARALLPWLCVALLSPGILLLAQEPPTAPPNVPPPQPPGAVAETLTPLATNLHADTSVPMPDGSARLSRLPLSVSLLASSVPALPMVNAAKPAPSGLSAAAATDSSQPAAALPAVVPLVLDTASGLVPSVHLARAQT